MKNDKLEDGLKFLKKILGGELSLPEIIKYLLSIPLKDEFENSIKQKFFDEFDQAEQVSKNLIINSFKLALEYVERQERPDHLFQLSSYNKLGIQSNETQANTILNYLQNIINLIANKRKYLFELPDIELLDYLNEFISRFGRAIEPYLKTIIVSIYNLQKVKQDRNFDDFRKGLGYYLKRLNIKRSEEGDYMDYRNVIKHHSFEISFNRKAEEVLLTFHLKRETRGRVYWRKTVKMELKEFEILFRDFRKFQNLFFYFYEIYIKSVEKDFKSKYWLF